jgi:hypothetical protein
MMFKPLSHSTEASVSVVVNGAAVRVPAGCTAAAAMLLAGADHTRTSALSGEPRAPYCMMGVCFECLMQIDGEANQQGCLVIVREGMRIEQQMGKREALL